MRLAIYARVSTEEQREGQTIDSQIAELERYARDKAWVVTGIYKDEGWSGGMMARPDLDRLRDDAKGGLFQAALINDVDRLARDVAHLGIIKRDLEKQDVRVIFRKLPSESSPTYNLMVNVLGSFAEFERELIADRTRRGRRHKVEVRKQYLGSNTAYGYRYIPKDRIAGKDGYLEVEPAQAATVRKMFEWVDLEGLSARRVIARLNDLGIPPQYGKHWGRSTVLRILHNEMYTGLWHYNKLQSCEPVKANVGLKYRRQMKTSRRRRPREEWLPVELPSSLVLVARDRWQRVQARLQRNRSFSPGNGKHFYLLQGLVKCGGCGARYTGDPCHGRFYYRCLARCHQQPSISEHILEQAVISATEELIQNPSLVLDQVERLNRSDPAVESTRQAEITEAETELRRIGIEEARLLEAYRSDIITAAQLKPELEKLAVRGTTAHGRRAELIAVKPLVEFKRVKKSVQDYCRETREQFRSLSPVQLREFLRTVIRSIVFDGHQIRIQGHLPAHRASEQHGAPAPNSPPVSGPNTPSASSPITALHRFTEIGVGGKNEFNQTQDERFVSERGGKRGGQETGRLGQWDRGRSSRGVGVDSDARALQTAQAQEVTDSGILWNAAVPVAARSHTRANAFSDHQPDRATSDRA